MNKFLLLFFLCAQAYAEEPPSSKKETAVQKSEDEGRVHADPRFKGKVKIYGTNSESFGEAPKGDEFKTKKLDVLYEEDSAPKPLPGSR